MGVGVSVGVGEGEGVAVGLGVEVGVGVGVIVGVGLGVTVGVAVDVGVGVGVGVGAAVILLIIAPNVPTAVPLSGSGKETPQNPSASRVCSIFQVIPPSVVLKIVPPETADPLLASAKETALSVNVPAGV